MGRWVPIYPGSTAFRAFWGKLDLYGNKVQSVFYAIFKGFGSFRKVGAHKKFWEPGALYSGGLYSRHYSIALGLSNLFLVLFRAPLVPGPSNLENFETSYATSYSMQAKVPTRGLGLTLTDFRIFYALKSHVKVAKTQSKKRLINDKTVRMGQLRKSIPKEKLGRFSASD